VLPLLSPWLSADTNGKQNLIQSQLRRLDCLDWAERFETALGAYLNLRFACQRILTAVFAGSLSWNARAALIQIKSRGGTCGTILKAISAAATFRRPATVLNGGRHDVGCPAFVHI
jgi:hypothetical protein